MSIIEALGNIVDVLHHDVLHHDVLHHDVLHHADPEDKAEVYKGLGLRLRYQPADSTVRAEVNPDPHQSLNHPHGEMVRVRGGT